MIKKIIGFLIFIFLIANINIVAGNENDNDVISVDYFFDQPQFKQVEIDGTTYDKIIIQDTSNFGNPGEPYLPIKGAYILLPQDTKVSNIKIETGEKKDLGNDFYILPSGIPVPVSEGCSFQIPIPDETIYNSDKEFPGKLFDNIGTYYYKGFKILVLSLYPVQYKPLSGELYYFDSLKVIIETVEEENDNPFLKCSEKDKIEVTKKIDNPVIADTYIKKIDDVSPQENYNLLILTDFSFKNDFKPLKNAHENHGLKTKIKTLLDISLNPDSITPEDIREYIRSEHQNNGIEYVLIGGDADIIPAKMLWVEGLDEETWHYETVMPSDLYYACLDGPYNNDGDSKWGETNDGEDGNDVDLFAEVFVGRACVDSKDDVENFVSKTVSYINWDLNDEYLDKALMAGEHLGDCGISSWGGNYLDLLIDGTDIDGYETVGIPNGKFTVDKLYDRDWENNYWYPEEIIQRINNDVHIINHDGHSWYNYNMKMDNTGVEYFTNDKYFFTYSHGCMAGGFDDPEGYDCFAEAVTVKTPNGAFAAIMNARYGFFWCYETDGDSTRYAREFWDAVFGEGISVISKANQDSKEDNLHMITRSMMRWTYYQLNLFGDPAVAFHTSDPPLKPDTPDGPNSGTPGTEYSYSSSTSDPDGDEIWYLFYWDDGTDSGWLGPFESARICEASHIWNSKGNYEIKVKAKDEWGAESEWSDPIKLSMSKNKILRYNSLLHPFLKFLENHQLLTPLLKFLLYLIL